MYIYIYNSRFSDHEQTQIATGKIDLRNHIAVVGCLPNIDIDIDEFCECIKISVATHER